MGPNTPLKLPQLFIVLYGLQLLCFSHTILIKIFGIVHVRKAYDKTQGSEVKEKEKARHQTNANS